MLAPQKGYRLVEQEEQYDRGTVYRNRHRDRPLGPENTKLGIRDLDAPGRGSRPPILVCTVGKTVLHYDLRIVADMHAWLEEQGDWVPLGNADEQKPAKEGTVEAWARSENNSIGGWYGLKKGLRGRVGNYVPPVLEALGLAEVEHDARNNRMRSL